MCYRPVVAPHPTIVVGSRVRALRRIEFTNGAAHQPNDEFIVNGGNLEYYQRFTDNKNYEVMSA